MDGDDEKRAEPRRRERLAAQAERMVESGRLTRDEAERLRAAGGPGEVDDAVRDIRVRHARASLDAAVGDGTMTREEADGFLARLRGGEHLRTLRARLRHRPRVRSRADSPGAGTQDPGKDFRSMSHGRLSETGQQSGREGDNGV